MNLRALTLYYPVQVYRRVTVAYSIIHVLLICQKCHGLSFMRKTVSSFTYLMFQILCTTLSDVLAQNPPDFPFLDDIKAISDATGYFFEYLKANGADSELGRAEASHQLPEFLLASLLMMKYLGVSAPLIAREMHICRYLPLDLFVEFWRDALHLGLTTPNQVHLYLIGPLFKRSLYNQKIQKTTRNFVKMLKIKDKSIRVEMNKLLGKVDLSDVEATFNYLLKIGYTSEQISQVPHLCAFKTEQISNLVRSPPADLRPYMENAKDNITKLKLIFVYLDRENGFELSNTTPRTKTS